MEEVRVYRLVNDKRIETEKIYQRGSSWNEGEDDCYILGINNWIVNSKGEFLVQKRSIKKKNNPGKWSSTNGLVQLGESNFEAVQRETEEELGIKINQNKILLFKENQVAGDHLIVDIFVSYADVELKDIRIQESEVDSIRFVSLEELLELDISTTCSYIKEFGPKIYDEFKHHKWDR